MSSLLAATAVCLNKRLVTLASFAIGILTLSGSSLAFSWTDGFNLEHKEGDRYRLIFSPVTHHFNYSDEHKYVWMVGGFRERSDGGITGAVFFKNSFGQPSTYIYPFGKIYRGLFDQPKLYAKVTAGLLYGYVGQYKNKVPFNTNGFSPGIVPALGWEHKGGYQSQINLLGTSAIMLQFSIPISPRY
jgi:hypothetical protein